MKNTIFRLIGIFFIITPLSLFAQNQRLDMGRFSFSLSPKVLKNGSIIDMELGYEYTEKYAGELHLRFSTETKNEQFDETIPDSLNAIDKSNFEVFLMPFRYFIIKRPHIKFMAGAGIYYGHNKLNEKGYFNMPSLENLGKERVNSFSNDFLRHTIGPDIVLGFEFLIDWFDISVHGGIVPIFYLYAYQKMGIIPLLEPNYADYSQNTWGIPYFYADVNIILFKYISFALLYDFSRLNYQVIDFDDNLNWNALDRAIIAQSYKLEASLLAPLGSEVYAQIGYGHTFDSTRIDSVSPIHNSRQYLILSVRKAR